MNLTQLKKAAKELNELLDVEELVDALKNKKIKQDVLQDLVVEASGLLKKGELESFSKPTVAILKELLTEEEEEDTVITKDDLSLEELVEEGNLTDLKKLVKTDESFTSLKKGLGKIKDVEELRKTMLAMLKEEQTTPPKEKGKKDKKKDKKKEGTGTKKSTKGLPSFQSIADGLLEKGAKQKEIISVFTKLYKERKDVSDAKYVEGRAAIYMKIAKKAAE